MKYWCGKIVKQTVLAKYVLKGKHIGEQTWGQNHFVNSNSTSNYQFQFHFYLLQSLIQVGTPECLLGKSTKSSLYSK